MVLRQVRCWFCALFESDSEYESLLMIQTPLSYKLNPIILKTFTRQNGIVTEVIGVTKRLRTVEKSREGDLLLSVIDETMRQIFGEAGAKVIYDFLANSSHLKREEIGEKPEVFSVGLERMLGSGAIVVENLILKNLCRRLALKFEKKEGYGFSDYVKELRKRCSC